MKLVYIHLIVAILFGGLAGYSIGISFIVLSIISFILAIIFLSMGMILYAFEKEKEKF